MNQYSYLENLNVFNNFPVDFEDWGAKDYDEMCGVEKYAYQTYRYFIKPYLKNPTQNTVMDINCGKGYGLACLKGEYGFKKVIGYNSDQNMLKACKDRHSGIPFYKDFILSKQKDADFILSFEAFNQYDNKSALLLRFSQALSNDGILVIVQSTSNEFEYKNYESVLEKVHGLKKLYTNDISDRVLNATKHYERHNDGSKSIAYASTISKLQRNSDDFKIFVSIFRK